MDDIPRIITQYIPTHRLEPWATKMRFYSIFAAITLTISATFADDVSPLTTDVDCLNICKDGTDNFACPPNTQKTELANVSSNYDDLMYHYK